jgi:transposase
MAKKQGPTIIEMTEEELNALRERVQTKQLIEADYPIVEQTIQFVLWIQIKLEHAKITMSKLKKLLFGSKTEKNKRSKNDSDNTSKKEKSTEHTTNETFDKPTDEKQAGTTNLASNQDMNGILSPSNTPIDLKIKHKGHGRIGASEYKPDEVIVVLHETLRPGADCPIGCGGRLYALPVTPGGIIRIKGQACAHVVSYEFNRLRCALCGETFTPKAPDDFHDEKYDEYFKSILVLEKYFVATPFYRQEHYQKMLGFPLPDATQWDCIESVADCVYPVFPVLEKMAADCKNINHDDTRVKILDVIRDNQLNPDKKRTGMYTTCIIAKSDDYEICLYYNSVKHGGENMAHLLEKRDTMLPPVLQMCDALAANTPTELKTILSHCLSHGRRKFTDIEAFFPEECNHVIDQLAHVYQNDAETKAANMSMEERLAYHQTHSTPIMEALYLWMQEQFDERKVEPNSALGAAIRYLQNHWAALTKFLSIAGAHLDNNIVERALKLAIRTRKNAMFYKTEHSAFVAALLLSLIATCELAKKNPIDYLTALQKNKSSVFKSPHLWLPWNYEATLCNTEKICTQKAA